MTLGLDLGTKTGFAYRGSGGEIVSGTWPLARPRDLRKISIAGQHRNRDPRFSSLWKKLTEVHETESIDYIVFEDVQFMSSQLQGQLWGGFRAIVFAWSEFFGATTQGVPVGTLKKFATNHGGATKGMMAQSLAKLGLYPLNADDNEVDAVFLLLYAEKILKL